MHDDGETFLSSGTSILVRTANQPEVKAAEQSRFNSVTVHICWSKGQALLKMEGTMESGDAFGSALTKDGSTGINDMVGKPKEARMAEIAEINNTDTRGEADISSGVIVTEPYANKGEICANNSELCAVKQFGNSEH